MRPAYVAGLMMALLLHHMYKQSVSGDLQEHAYRAWYF